MRNFILAVLLMLLASPARASDIPTTFEFYIGNNLSGYTRFELKSGELYYEDHRDPRFPARPQILTIPDKDWHKFRIALDTRNVWMWNKDYLNTKVADGTQWNLEIKYPDNYIKATGSNAYPLFDGVSNNSPQQSENFKQFLLAVSELTRIEFH